MIKLLFNYNNTVGKVLGFKNVGTDYAITEYSDNIKNIDKYKLELSDDDTYDSTKIDQYNILNLSNNTKYILMYLNNYNNILVIPIIIYLLKF